MLESDDPGYALDEIQARAAASLARSEELTAAGSRTAARPVWDYNHVIAYGQSLSSGWEGWPALSVQPRHDSLMIGDSVHGTSEHGAGFEPAGEAVFRPLAATVMSNGARGELLSPEAVAALKPGNPALGETILEGALDFWRGRQMALRASRNDDSFAGRLVATSCGVGGRSIEQLSFGKGPFNRPRIAAETARRMAGATQASYGIAALLWLQGEGNSVGKEWVQDRAEYVQLSATLQADFNREIVANVAGQERMPAVFAHQVSGMYVRDDNEMSIPMAQLDCAYQLPDWFLAAPSYPVTEKGGHLDANGYRWLGQQFGKVMHKVLDLGEGWKPLHPLRATVRGRKVLVDFHVPHPPLAFGPCYRRLTPTSFPDGGFSVGDDAGRIGVAAAAVVAGTCVLLVLEREPGANPVLWYADQTVHGGYGNLHDSDATQASAAYEYREGSGQYPAANIAELVGKPYPLWNWCVAFRMALEPDPRAVADAADAGEEQPTAPEPPTPAPSAEADSPAWQVLRGTAPPMAAPAPPAPDPRQSWLRRLFRGN